MAKTSPVRRAIKKGQHVVEQELATELAVINSVQTALDSQLDFNGVIEAVGNKITEIFPGENV